MAEQDQDKTEEPTPFRLQQARKQGQVPKSLELNSFFMLLAFLGTVGLLAEPMIKGTLHAGRALLSQAHAFEYSDAELSTLIHWFVQQLGSILGPMFLVIAIGSILMNIVQTGPLFTVVPLKPDVKRINPVSGFKRVFSVRMLFEALKSIIKILIFAVVVYLAMRALLPTMAKLMQSEPRAVLRPMLHSATVMIASLVAAYVIVAALDFIHSRREYRKKMRMSRRELKDEVKRREGDPQIKSKIRQIQKEAAKRTKAIRRVPESDVLITNPTHLAIALRYKRGVDQSPEVIAKGAGESALYMRKLARQHGVPVLEQKNLARRLFRSVALDSYVPPEMFPEVAKALVWAYRVKKLLPEPGVSA